MQWLISNPASSKYLIPSGMNKYFSVNRFLYLLRLEVFRSRKGIVMTMVIIFGVSFFMGMLMNLSVEPAMDVFDHREGFGFTLIMGGFVLSSLAFHGLRNSLSRYQYLMLPVSALERFLAMWLLTTIGWVIVFTVIFTVYTVLANFLGQLLFSHVKFAPFNPISAQSAAVTQYYFVTQGVFLAGAAKFRAYVFPRMLVVFTILGIAIGTSGYLFLKDVFILNDYCEGGDCNILEMMESHRIWDIARFLFWWVLAPLSWLITYFGLKDQEV
jgi:hypothetical protein